MKHRFRFIYVGLDYMQCVSQIKGKRYHCSAVRHYGQRWAALDYAKAMGASIIVRKKP